MAEERQRYSDSDLQEFKELIQQKIEKAEKDLMLIRESPASHHFKWSISSSFRWRPFNCIWNPKGSC